MSIKKTAFHDSFVPSGQNQVLANRLFTSMVTVAIATAATIAGPSEEAGAFTMSSSQSLFMGSSMNLSQNMVMGSGSGSNCMSMNQSLPGLGQSMSMCAPKPPKTGGITIGGNVTSTGGITINGKKVTSTGGITINGNKVTSSTTISQVINTSSQTSSLTSLPTISQPNLSQNQVISSGSGSNSMSMNQSLPGLGQSMSMSAPQPPSTGGITINGNTVTSSTTSSQTNSQISINSQTISQNLSQVGRTQINPVMPTRLNNGVFSFVNARTGLWFDPPTAFGFEYTMTDNSLFTNILDFPTGFSQPFSVSVQDISLGNFTAGQAVNFSDYSNILGNLLVSGSGVSEFSVTGINVDPTNPSAFPIQLQFNTDTASFEQRAIPHPQASKSVPEPSAVLGLLFMSATGMFGALHKRQQQQ